MRLPWRGKKPKADAGALLLSGGRRWTGREIVDGDLLLAGGRIAESRSVSPEKAERRLDLGGLLVTPGLIDACHPLAEDAIAPLKPGPYLDWHRREEEIMNEPPGELAEFERLTLEQKNAAGVWSCLSNGATTAIGLPARQTDERWVDTPSLPWVRSLVWDKSPQAAFKRAKNSPVVVFLADGTSKAAAREMEKLRQFDMLGPNLVAVGGAGLTKSDAHDLAVAGASLVWRPVIDRFVLGQTVAPDVFRVEGLCLLLGGGARRDGGEGLLAALQAADGLGYCSRERLLAAVWGEAAKAFALEQGALATGKPADLACWRADDPEAALFKQGRDALELVISAGRVVFCRQNWFDQLGKPGHLRPVSGEKETFCVVDRLDVSRETLGG